MSMQPDYTFASREITRAWETVRRLRPEDGQAARERAVGYYHGLRDAYRMLGGDWAALSVQLDEIDARYGTATAGKRDAS